MVLERILKLMCEIGLVGVGDLLLVGSEFRLLVSLVLMVGVLMKVMKWCVLVLLWVLVGMWMDLVGFFLVVGILVLMIGNWK